MALATGVITWDLLAPPGNNLSEAADDYLTRWCAVTEAGLLLLYLHVANKLPARLDPIHGAFVGLKALRRAIAATYFFP
ncbi:hypothetical protein MSS2_04719 [Mycobacterium marinum]|uniref:DUF7427 family protein n=1 Tax=Mycobacterium marinum TaxID=1781 RepID=UPI000E3E0526|nr:hypothetical protein [Mycobacterium marinum]RFZ48552.1 hypothetical protein MSS2_04719 [Mycobacterium marinum]